MNYRSSTYLKHSLLCTLWGVSLLGARFAEASEVPTTPTAIIGHTVSNIYAPSFSQFSQVAESHNAAANTYCNGHSDSALAQLRAEFKSLVASYSSIEFFRIGALNLDNRLNRFFYWPDKRRVVERQLRTLVFQLSSSTLTSEELSNKSVAVQGLPALERLIFGRHFQQQISSIEKVRNCRLILAISANIVTMSGNISADWHPDSRWVRSLLNAEQNSDYFRSDDEVLRSIVTQIIVGVDVVLNRKIAPLHGSEVDIRKAPLWRSEQSLSMISNNLNSLRALTIDSGLAQISNLASELAFEFRSAEQMLQKLKQLPTLVDNRGEVVADAQLLARSLSAVVGGIQYTLNDRFTQMLGVSAGFNSEYGD